MSSEMIVARRSQLIFYRDVSLYVKVKDGVYTLYKPSGMSLSDMRIDEERHPSVLYINKTDKIRGIQEAQKGFNRELKKDIKSGNQAKVKETLVNIVEETLTEPRSGSLEGVSETVDILVSDYASEFNVIKNLLSVSSKDYTTALHSINVMALSIGFAFHSRYSLPETKVLGLCGLLHDVGKSKIDHDILVAQRRLTEEEFKKMQQHTILGHNILQKCKFSDKRISLAALEHHEKLDGGGYPNGKSIISETSQALGIVDCYEALTNDDRPYRHAAPPFKALQIIKKDVGAGKYNKDIFSDFIHYLGKKDV
jgi:putative nucleotidyltransferase with HDIG domain